MSERLRIEIEQEADGRWIAEIPDLPGVLAYGSSREDAIQKAEALALRALADRLDHGESIPAIAHLFANAWTTTGRARTLDALEERCMPTDVADAEQELAEMEATSERVSPGALEIYAMFVGQDEALSEAEAAMAAYGLIEQPIVSSAHSSF